MCGRNSSWSQAPNASLHQEEVPGVLSGHRDGVAMPCHLWRGSWKVSPNVYYVFLSANVLISKRSLKGYFFDSQTLRFRWHVKLMLSQLLRLAEHFWEMLMPPMLQWVPVYTSSAILAVLDFWLFFLSLCSLCFSSLPPPPHPFSLSTSDFEILAIILKIIFSFRLFGWRRTYCFFKALEKQWAHSSFMKSPCHSYHVGEPRAHLSDSKA